MFYTRTHVARLAMALAFRINRLMYGMRDAFSPAMSEPRQLTDIAAECCAIFLRASSDLGNDLAGLGVLDLMADNIEHVSLADLKTAIIVAGIYNHASARIQRQIAGYR